MFNAIRFALAAALLGLSPATSSAPPDDHGGGGVEARHFADYMPHALRDAIEAELHASALRLAAEGRLPAPRGALTPGSLGWPLRAAAGYQFEDYHGVSNFVDLDPDYPNQLLDYMCGTRTYDLDSGYNHAGIDYFLWPYPWLLMDQGLIEIVAVAPGVILLKHDGNDDRSCSLDDGGQWNAVYVQHADGSVAWYGHMRKGSLTAKSAGDPVAQGEFLGLIGSSGFSSGPHLHLELRSSSVAGADIYEPHQGACNDTIDDSLWQDQRPYFDTALNGIATHDAPPSNSVDCPDPGQEQPNFSNFMELGAPAYFSVYFRDALPGQETTTLRLIRPDQSLHWEWTRDGPPQFFSAAWYWWHFNSLGTDESRVGEWRFEVEFGEQSLSRTFFYGEIPDEILVDRFEGAP